MKRLIVLIIAATLCGLAASAQEASDSNANGIEISIISRLDLNPYFSVNGEKPDWGLGGTAFGLGNTSIYTLIEGNWGEHWSYSIANHWLSDDPKLLYTNTLYANDCNWVDWANITFSTLNHGKGSWHFTLGKDYLALGSIELDEYDFDCHIDMCSYVWNNLPIYQWGGSIAYLLPDDCTKFRLQISSSPFNEKFFDSGLLSYSLQWCGEYDYYYGLYSVNFLEDSPGFKHGLGIISMGNQFYLGDFTLTLDYMSRQDNFSSIFKSGSITGSLKYSLGEKADFFAKGGWEYCNGEDYFADWCTEPDADVFSLLKKPYWFAGIGAHYYPLKDSQDLRLHTTLSYNNDIESISFNIGVSYNFQLSKYFKR